MTGTTDAELGWDAIPPELAAVARRCGVSLAELIAVRDDPTQVSGVPDLDDDDWDRITAPTPGDAPPPRSMRLRAAGDAPVLWAPGRGVDALEERGDGRPSVDDPTDSPTDCPTEDDRRQARARLDALRCGVAASTAEVVTADVVTADVVTADVPASEATAAEATAPDAAAAEATPADDVTAGDGGRRHAAGWLHRPDVAPCAVRRSRFVSRTLPLRDEPPSARRSAPPLAHANRRTRTAPRALLTGARPAHSLDDPSHRPRRANAPTARARGPPAVREHTSTRRPAWVDA